MKVWEFTLFIELDTYFNPICWSKQSQDKSFKNFAERNNAHARSTDGQTDNSSIEAGQSHNTTLRVEQEIRRNKENGGEHEHWGRWTDNRRSLSTHNGITQNGQAIREKCCLSCLWLHEWMLAAGWWRFRVENPIPVSGSHLLCIQRESDMPPNAIPSWTVIELRCVLDKTSSDSRENWLRLIETFLSATFQSYNPRQGIWSEVNDTILGIPWIIDIKTKQRLDFCPNQWHLFTVWVVRVFLAIAERRQETEPQCWLHEKPSSSGMPIIVCFNLYNYIWFLSKVPEAKLWSHLLDLNISLNYFDIPKLSTFVDLI